MSTNEREALKAIVRMAEAAKEPCGMHPESPAAIRNGKLAAIAQVAAQGLGLVRGPSLAHPPAPAQGTWKDAWQPIETAPREEEILGWRDDCGPLLIMHTSFDRFATDRECDETDEETLFAKDWFGAGIPGGFQRLEGSEQPTHWMPLPPPPEPEQAHESGEAR